MFSAQIWLGQEVKVQNSSVDSCLQGISVVRHDEPAEGVAVGVVGGDARLPARHGPRFLPRVRFGLVEVATVRVAAGAAPGAPEASAAYQRSPLYHGDDSVMSSEKEHYFHLGFLYLGVSVPLRRSRLFLSEKVSGSSGNVELASCLGRLRLSRCHPPSPWCFDPRFLLSPLPTFLEK